MWATVKNILKFSRKQTSLKFYKAMSIPVLLNCSKNWTLTKPQTKRAEAAEMKIPLAACTLRDVMRSEDISLGQQMKIILHIFESQKLGGANKQNG